MRSPVGVQQAGFSKLSISPIIVWGGVEICFRGQAATVKRSVKQASVDDTSVAQSFSPSFRRAIFNFRDEGRKCSFGANFPIVWPLASSHSRIDLGVIAQ
jgi:hypothetical protein